MTGNLNLFSTFHSHTTPFKVTLADGFTSFVLGSGTVDLTLSIPRLLCWVYHHFLLIFFLINSYKPWIGVSFFFLVIACLKILCRSELLVENMNLEVSTYLTQECRDLSLVSVFNSFWSALYAQTSFMISLK